MLVRRKIYLIYIAALLSGAIGFKDIALEFKSMDSIFGVDIYALFLGAVYLVLSMSIMEYFVFYRLKRIDKELSEAQVSGYSNGRKLFNSASNDEIGSIIENINSALCAVCEKTKDKNAISEMYHSLVNDSPIFVYRFDAEGTVTFASESYLLAYSISEEDMVGKSVYEHINMLGGNGSKIQSKIAVLGPNRRSTSFTYDIPLVVNQEVPKWPAWSVSAIMDNKGCIIEYQAVGVNMYSNEEAVLSSASIDRTDEIIIDLIHEKDKPSIALAFKQAKEYGLTTHRNCRIKDYNGQYVPAQLSVSVDVKGELVVHAIDITQIESAQKEVEGAVESMNRAIVSSKGSSTIVF